jgi:hypothetical protein
MGGKIRGGVDKNFRNVDGNFPTSWPWDIAGFILRKI